jgi:hypothetical protein
MKRSDFLPLLLLIPLLGFVAVQVTQASHLTATSEAAMLGPSTRIVAPSAANGLAAAGTDAASPAEAMGADDRDVADIRRRLILGERGTYISEILLQRDSALARWPERVAQPVRVWVGSGAQVEGWDSTFTNRVHEAFDEWTSLGIPLKFTFVVDSSDSDVRVTWIDHFDTPISGKTLWARDRNFWIVNGSITLALHHNGGEALDDRAIKAIALHEVGHLLGLDHTVDTTNIMTARVRVRDLSDADRATMKLLYSLPPGSVKG